MDNEPKSSQERERLVRDAQAADYEGVRRKAYSRWFELIERQALIDLLRPPLQGWLLDAGCSTGRLTPVLEKVAERVVSADFSLGSLRFALLRRPGARYVQADIAALPFDKIFSAVICLDVLHHVAAAKRLEVLRAFREVLADNGRVVASIWNRSSFAPIFRLPPEGRFPSGIYYQAMTEEESAELFNQVGFKDVRVTGLGHVLYSIRSLRCTSTLYRFFGWASLPWERWLTRKAPGAWRKRALYYLITARK